MSEDFKQTSDLRIEGNYKCYKLLINEKIMYLRFGLSIFRDNAEEIEKIIEIIENHQNRVYFYIFDLTDLKKFDLRCCRPFAIAQNQARKQHDSFVITIQPELPSLKKILSDQGVIRPREICESRTRLFDLVKHLEKAHKKDSLL